MTREDLGALSIVLAVAEEQSFTRAAVQLGMSQAAVSQAVRRLETRLGLRLLTRTTRSVAPTAAGEELLQTLRPALADIDARLTRLTTLRASPAGTVRLTSNRHAAETLILPALTRMVERYPDVQVELAIEASLTDIVAQRFDAGVRLGERVERDMIAVRIGPPLRMLVVGSPDYLARHGTPATPHDLPGHRCINIRLPTAGALYAWEFEKDEHALNVRVEGSHVFNDMGLAIAAAQNGLGLAMAMADQVAPAIGEGRLVAVLDDWCPPFPGYHLYYPDRRHPAPAFSALLEVLREGAR